MSIKKPFFVQVSSQEVLFFTKHLATMIKAGIPLAEALGGLRDQASTSSFRYVLNEVHSDVLNGQTLTVALSKHPQVFNQLFSKLIAASEKAGTLDKNLEFLAVQLNKSQILTKKIQGALMYPGLVLTATFGMGGYISLFILPQLVDFFNTFDSELPLPTKILLSFSNLMKDYGIMIIFGLVISFILGSILVKTSLVKPFWHKFLLRIPIFGKLLKYSQLARFTRNLSVLLTSGVPIVASLETTSETLSNVVFQSQCKIIAEALSKGTQMGAAFSKLKQSEFPELVSKMINIGEKTGKLDEMLFYLAEFYEEEIDDISKNFSTLLEPALLLVIGVIVGFVAIAIISPIYELTGSLR